MRQNENENSVQMFIVHLFTPSKMNKENVVG